MNARQDYMTVARGGGISELVKVTGFETLRVGRGTEYERDEQWCRVRFYADGAKLLMHPANLIAGSWKVTDPARVAAGFYGVGYHKTKAEAERRVAMFPGSVMEWVPGEAP